MSTKLEYACYLFVNKDIKMSTGKKMAQAAHAVVGFYQNLDDKSDYVKDCFEIWSNTGHKTITLTATQEEMNELHDMYPSVKVHDSGRTQVRPGSFTVLGVYPKLCDPEEFIRFKLVN